MKTFYLWLSKAIIKMIDYLLKHPDCENDDRNELLALKRHITDKLMKKGIVIT